MQNDVGDLGKLTPAPGSLKKRKRIGRGRGSGHGDTATKGHKGAQSRSGYSLPAWFEGGQMPLNRRMPKRGFRSRNRVPYQEIKLGDLERIQADTIDPDIIRKARLVKGRGPIVLLGGGDVARKLNIKVHRITKSADEKIKAAGGTVEILPIDPVDLRIKTGPKPKESKSKKGKEAK